MSWGERGKVPLGWISKGKLQLVNKSHWWVFLLLLLLHLSLGWISKGKLQLVSIPHWWAFLLLLSLDWISNGEWQLVNKPHWWVFLLLLLLHLSLNWISNGEWQLVNKPQWWVFLLLHHLFVPLLLLLLCLPLFQCQDITVYANALVRFLLMLLFSNCTVTFQLQDGASQVCFCNWHHSSSSFSSFTFSLLPSKTLAGDHTGEIFVYIITVKPVDGQSHSNFGAVHC